MTTFLARVMGSGASQTRPEGGAPASLLGPARPIGLAATPARLIAFAPVLLINPDRMYDTLPVYGPWTTIQTSTIGSS